MKKYKIFLVIGGQATTYKGSKIWIKNFYDPLVKLGHEVTLLDIDDYLMKYKLVPNSKEAKELLSSKLPTFFLGCNLKTKYDLFISYLHNGQIYPDVFKEIKKSIFTINYSTNYHQFPMYEEIAKIVDLNIYISKCAKEGFDSLGVKSYYMPFAANPDFYRPSSSKNNEMVFIGSSYGIRPYVCWRLLQNGIDLHIYGPSWKQQRRFNSSLRNLSEVTKLIYSNVDSSLRILDERLRKKIIEKINLDFEKNIHLPLSDQEYVKKLAEASMVINFSESRYSQDFLNHKVLLGSNLRDFETTMSGTFLLTQYSNELNDFFTEDKEVVSFKNEHELIDKLLFYSKNKDIKERIAKAGYLRAKNEHTWEHRFTSLFNSI